MTTKTTLSKSITEDDVTAAKNGSLLQDLTQKKLHLRVSPKGKAVWLFYGRNPQTKVPKREVLGLARGQGALSVKEARASADAKKVEIQKASATKPSAVPTFGDILDGYAKPWVVTWFDRYCDDWRDRKLDWLTQDMVETRERRILREAGERQRLRDENGGNAERGNAGMTSVSVVGKALRTCYKIAKEKRGYLGQDMGQFMSLTPNKARKRVLTQAEEKRFFDALESPTLSPWVKDFFTLLYWTGVRWGSLAKARFSEIDLDDARWIIPGHKSKNGEDYRVTLTDEAVAILRKRLEERVDGCVWVFPGAKDPKKHLTDITYPWKQIKELAELSGPTPHDIRRSYGSKMASKNVSLLVIKELMGHKSIRTTEMFYAHVSEDAQREALKHLTR